MDAFCAFLARLQPRDWDFDLSGHDLALEHIGGEVRKVVLANHVQRDDRLAVVLSHQDESSVHFSSWAAG